MREHAGPIHSLYVFRDVNLLKGCQASREEEGRARGINKAGGGGREGVNSAIFKYRYIYAPTHADIASSSERRTQIYKYSIYKSLVIIVYIFKQSADSVLQELSYIFLFDNYV